MSYNYFRYYFLKSNLIKLFKKFNLPFVILSSSFISYITIYKYFYNKNIKCYNNKNEKYNDPLWRSKIRKSLENSKDVCIISGTANKELSIEVADRLNLELEHVKIDHILTGEININFENSLLGKSVFIIQPTSPSVNSNLAELLFLILQAKREGAKEIHAIIPYLGYSTYTTSLDHKNPICSADIAKMLKTAGANTITTLDVHTGQIEGFYDIPFDDIPSDIILTEYILNSNLITNFNKFVLVSPNANRIKRCVKQAESIAKRTGVPSSIAMTISKNSFTNNMKNKNSNNIYLIGDVKGKDCIIIDDIIKSGKSIFDSAKELKINGARKVYAFTSHYLYLNLNNDYLENSHIDKLITTNSTSSSIIDSKKLIVLSVGPLLAEIIRRIHNKESVSELINDIV